MTSRVLKAVSLWQPWASAWLLPGQKTFETRSWYTSHRGQLLVHAAKKRDGDVRFALEDEELTAALAESGVNVADLPFGALIGKVELIGCCRMDRMPAPSERERIWGDWQPERFAWERGRFRMFQTPIPYKGSQGLFDVPADLVAGAL